MRYYSLIVSFLALTLCGSSSLNAQEVWTLERSIRHALTESISMQQSQLATRSAEIDLEQAKQAKYPNLSGNLNLNLNFGRTIDPTSNSFITETFFANNYGIGSGVILYNGSRIKNTVKRRAIDLNAVQNDAKQASIDLSLSVALTYLNILFAVENIEIANKQVTLNQQQANRTQKSIDAGIIPAAELLNIQAQITQSEQGVIAAQNTYEIALLQLKQLLRLDPTEDIKVEVPADVEITTDPDLITFNDLLNYNISTRPDIKAAELRATGGDLDVALARSGYLPSVSLFGNVGTNYSNQAREVTGFEDQLVESEIFINNMPVTISQAFQNPIFQRTPYGAQLENFLSYGFGVGVNIPIYSNGVNKANVQRAQLGIENQELQKQLLIDNIKTTLQQSLADAKAAKKQYEASEKSLAAQKASLDNVTKRLEIGAANSFEWEAQQTQLENLELQRLINKYDYLFKVKVLEFYLGKQLKF